MAEVPAAAARAEIAAISIVTALCLCGDSFLYIALPLHWEEAGLGSLFEVGVILAANRIVRLPLNPLITIFYKRFSCWTGLFLATLLSIVATAGYGIGKGLAVWLLLRFVWGLAWTLLRLGTLFSILRVGTKETVGQLTGLNNGLYRLGSLAGMLLGGLLADTFGLAPAAFFFAAVAAVAPFVMVRSLPRSADGSAGHRGDGSWAALNWRAVFSRDPKGVLWVMMTAFVVAMTYQGLTASTISIRVDVFQGGGIVVLGAVLSAATLAGVLQSLRWVWEPFLAPLFGRLSDGAFGRVRLTAVSFALAALALFLSALPLPLPLLCAALLLVLLSATLLTTASDSLGNEAAMRSDDSRVFLSVFALFTDLGAAVGPLFAYAVVAVADLSVAWILVAAMLLAFAAHWWRKREGAGA